MSEWLGETVEAPLEDVKVEWAAPNGTPGIIAVQVQTPRGLVRIDPSGGDSPEPQHLEPRRDLRGREPAVDPEGRLWWAMSCASDTGWPAATSSTSAAGPASTCRGSRGQRRRAGVEPHPDLVAWPGGAPGPCPTSPCTRAPRRRCRCPTRPSTSRTRRGRTSRAGLRAGAGRAGPGRTRWRRGLVVDNDPTRSTFRASFRRGYRELPEPAIVGEVLRTTRWTPDQYGRRVAVLLAAAWSPSITSRSTTRPPRR